MGVRFHFGNRSKERIGMSLLSGLSRATVQTVLLTIGFVALVRFVVGSDWVWLIGFSFAFHFLNFRAFLWRKSDLDDFIVQAVVFRGIAIGLLVGLLVRFGIETVNAWAVGVLIVGTALHLASLAALGWRRTYYGAELNQLGELTDAPPVNRFPYNILRHPMGLGALLQFIGLFFLVPGFVDAYPALFVGHVFLTVLTAVMEHFNWHITDHFFHAYQGRFEQAATRETIDGICSWSLSHFKTDLGRSCSMHRYIKTLPSDVIEKIDEIRFHDRVLAAIQEKFPNSKLVPLPMTDELYISRYNLDRGGDQGLFDRHHDGNLRFMPGMSVVRSLLYLSSEDKLEVVFDSSDVRANMKTYDFGLLDFHKELHWVDGSYDPEKPPRILLKCNYYVDHWNWAPYRALGIGMNVAVFYVVKAAMEYSKSPQTIAQSIIGWLCNVFRRLNNLSPSFPIALVVAVVAISLRMLVVITLDQPPR